MNSGRHSPAAMFPCKAKTVTKEVQITKWHLTSSYTQIMYQVLIFSPLWSTRAHDRTFLCALVNYNKLPVPVYYPTLSDSNDAGKQNGYRLAIGLWPRVVSCSNYPWKLLLRWFAANTSLVLKTACGDICWHLKSYKFVQRLQVCTKELSQEELGMVFPALFPHIPVVVSLYWLVCWQ